MKPKKSIKKPTKKDLISARDTVEIKISRLDAAFHQGKVPYARYTEMHRYLEKENDRLRQSIKNYRDHRFKKILLITGVVLVAVIPAYFLYRGILRLSMKTKNSDFSILTDGESGMRVGALDKTDFTTEIRGVHVVVNPKSSIALEGEILHVTERNFYFPEDDNLGPAAPVDLVILRGSRGSLPDDALENLQFRTAATRALTISCREDAREEYDGGDPCEKNLASVQSSLSFLSFIPSTEEMRKRLISVRKTDRIRLTGYIVNAKGDYKSPLTASVPGDTGERPDWSTLFDPPDNLLRTKYFLIESLVWLK